MERAFHLPLPIFFPRMGHCHCYALSSTSPLLLGGASNNDGDTEDLRSARVADFRTGMTEAGMQNLQDPPTDQELRLYYATCAPAHRIIHQRSYDSAATEYRRLAEASRDSVLRPRYETIACQLDFCGRMKAADIAFPPSAADLHTYFYTLKQRSLDEIQSAFQEYANAFYVPVETEGVIRRDVRYSAEGDRACRQRWRGRVPPNWSELNSKRDLHLDGRRIIDGAGFAYLGQRCLIAAGFSEGLFAAMARTDQADETKNDSCLAHLMFTARRTNPEERGTLRHKRTEVVVVSNGRLHWAVVDPPQDVATVELTTLRSAYQTAFESAQDNINMRQKALVLHREAWQALELLSRQK